MIKTNRKNVLINLKNFAGTIPAKQLDTDFVSISKAIDDAISLYDFGNGSLIGFDSISDFVFEIYGLRLKFPALMFLFLNQIIRCIDMSENKPSRLFCRTDELFTTKEKRILLRNDFVLLGDNAAYWEKEKDYFFIIEGKVYTNFEFDDRNELSKIVNVIVNSGIVANKGV
ncbi:MAG: hypothetical protein K2I88_06895 [Anaeroplasmataceae bacterium]|nr:hypothetical protein [Anaeroplasmataceae bacterium]